jgi:hypothetical protein
MNSAVSYLKMLTDASRRPEAEVITRAFQVGLRQLWHQAMREDLEWALGN